MMNPYPILIKAHLKQLLGINKLRYTKSKTEKTKMMAMGAIMIYAAVTFVGITTWYAFMLANSLESVGGLNLLPLLGLILISLIIIIFSTYSIQGSVFTSKDYSLLFSLPIKPLAILLSKLFFTYIVNCLVTAAFFIPIMIIYYLKTGCSPWVFVMTLFAIVFVPLLPTLIATLLAYGTSFIASCSKKHGSIVILFLMITLTLAALALQLNAHKLLQLLLIHREMIYDNIKLFYPPAYYLTTALVDLDIMALINFALYSILPTMIILALLAKSLKKIVAKLGETHQMANYTLGHLKANSAVKALYYKEVKRYLASPIYVMNTSIGMLLVVIMAIGSFFLPDQLEALLQIPELQTYLVGGLVAVLAGSATLSFTSSVSISMEGKNLWIVKSLPIAPITLFTAKILLNLTVCLPAILLASLLFTFKFNLNLLDLFYLLSIPSLYALLTATLGLLVNLFFPKLDWSSETAVVKQSASSMISIFLGIGLIGTPVGLFFLLRPQNLTFFFLGLIVVLIVLNSLSLYLIRMIGVKHFNKIY